MLSDRPCACYRTVCTHVRAVEKQCFYHHWQISLLTFLVFDTVTEKLLEAKYVIIERELRDNIWIYHCKCVEGTRQTYYLQSLSSTVTGESLTAASSVYGNCIHIEATEKLMESFDRENNITPSLARDTYSHDHTYQEEHHDLLPMNGNNFTIFVHGNKQHGVVGLQGALITYFICDHEHHNCEHVTKKQAIQASSKGAKKTKNKSQLHELCTVNGIKFEKLQKGAGKNVASLEMFFSGFPKIIGMENFPDLQNLTLMGQQITTLENLDCLPNLTELCVSESKITAISGLDGCKKLKKLFLYDNKITKIENISHLEQLNVLWLNNNNIIAIEGLEKLLYLLDLNLAGNKITEIGNSLNGNLNLKTLNLSANCIASLKDLTNLSQLPCLESLSLKDPVYGPNPVALLCNYSTHLLFHLPNLKRVDSYNVDDKTLKELAETTVVKKKMYYNMRVKTMQRNKADLLFRLETERANLQAESRNRMLKLFSAVKDIEREVEEQREGLSSSFKENKNPISPVAGDEGKKENLEEKETLATDTMMFLQTLQKKKEALLKRISKLQRQREEYKSCHDLVFSRFCVGDYLGLGISGIKVHRITRIHNRILRTRFDDKLDLILDRDDVSELTQLDTCISFCGHGNAFVSF